jgi:tetratricopeptide (TPR) repeat protein
VGSIFLFSERNGMCVELKASEIGTRDLVDLQGLLPRNLKGISFNRPSLPQAERTPELFRSESRGPHVSRYLTDVGQKLLTVGQPQGALRFFDLALRVRPEPETALLRAKTLVALGRMDEAHREVDRFLRWQPINGLGFYLLGRIYMARNDFQSTEQYLRRADRFLPDGDPQREVVRTYLDFNRLFLDRDALYGRNLSPHEYIREITQLQTRVRGFKSRIQANPHPEIQGMEPHLDTLDKLFQRWLDEIGPQGAPANT